MRIAVLEDDLDLARLVSGWLVQAQHEVAHFGTGEALLAALPAQRFDLLVLDWLLPGVSGLEVLKRLRTGGNAVPVLFLTQFDSADNVATALDAGANDYLAKPVTSRLLLSRIQALLGASANDAPRDISCGAYRTIAANHTVVVGDRSVQLSPSEHALAWLLLAHAGRLLSRSELRRVAWQTERDGDGGSGVDLELNLVKLKLGLDGSQGLTLTKVHNLGYRLEIAVGAEPPALR